MHIPRYYEDLSQFYEDGRAIIIYGPRRVGKTTLLKKYLSNQKQDYSFFTGENIRLREIFGSKDKKKILQFAEDMELLVIDEAQYIPHIGRGLKILVDYAEDLQVIATGSSSFDLSNQVGEPLTGRKWELNLYPVSQMELLEDKTKFELTENLEEYLIYGSYPEVITANSIKKKRKLVSEIVDSYLLKDVIAFEDVKASQKIFKLLQMLAFQVGSEVSVNELATNLGIGTKKVERYLDLLEKMFVIFRLSGFSRNLRKEISKKDKFYFYDLGVRNALITAFNPLDVRDDIGQIWENFVIVERLKQQEYKDKFVNNYFWRTYDQQEIDFVEEKGGKLYGYEIKWSEDTQAKAPKQWQEAYDNTEFEVINSENYLEFIV